MKENPHLKKMKPYHPGASIEKIKKQYQVECIKLASNENPLGTAVKENGFKGYLNQLNLYPDLKSSELTKRISDHVKLPQDHIGIGNGSDELLYCLALAFLSPKDELISSDVTFSQYEFVTQVVGATYKPVKMKQYKTT